MAEMNVDAGFFRKLSNTFYRLFLSFRRMGFNIGLHIFAASFFPTIFGGLYFRWGTDLGALASMVSGMVINLVWRFGVRFTMAGMEQVHEIFPAFIGSLLVYVLVSKLTVRRRPDSGSA